MRTILPPFEGPRLKIKRAKQHIADIRALVQDFANRADVVYTPIGAMTDDQIEYKLSFTECPPENIPVILGDAVHNLRTSLDLLICDVARLLGKSEKKLYFPFAKDLDDLNKTLFKTEFRRLGADVLSEIRKAAPFREGNANLRGLHDLDIRDKHRTIIPVYLVGWDEVVHPSVLILGAFPQLAEFFLRPLPVTEDTKVTAHKSIHPTNVRRMRQGSAQPHFPLHPPDLPFAGQPVIITIESLAHLTANLLETFAGKFGELWAKVGDGMRG